jgi:quercetin dioxygenase-like cupin family protein
MHIQSASERSTKVAAAENFTGQVFLDGLVASEPPSRLNATLVTFTPGARTAWHRHGFRQLLFATVGSGFVQVKGKPACELHPGDVAIIPPNAIHWHGAAPTACSHIWRCLKAKVKARRGWSTSPTKTMTQSIEHRRNSAAVADGLFAAEPPWPFSSEISKIDQSMPIVVETEQMSNG